MKEATKNKPTFNIDDERRGNVVFDSSAQTQAGASLSALIVRRQELERTNKLNDESAVLPFLADCLAFHEAQLGASPSALAHSAALWDFSKRFGVEMGARSTNEITRLLRCIFFDGDNLAMQARISLFNRALRAAVARKLTSKDLAEFIRRCGGLHAIDSPDLSNDVKAKRAAAALQGSCIGQFRLDDFAAPCLAGERALFIATRARDGSFLLEAVVNDRNVLKAALAAHYNATHP